MIIDFCGDADLERLRNADLSILFKHSTACPVSFRAFREVQLFAELHSEIPVFLIKVIEQRTWSDRLAEFFNIRHESPQVIVIRRGRAAEHASHGRVTREVIEKAIQQVPV